MSFSELPRAKRSRAAEDGGAQPRKLRVARMHGSVVGSDLVPLYGNLREVASKVLQAVEIPAEAEQNFYVDTNGVVDGVAVLLVAPSVYVRYDVRNLYFCRTKDTGLASRDKICKWHLEYDADVFELRSVRGCMTYTALPVVEETSAWLKAWDSEGETFRRVCKVRLGY